MNRVGRIGRRTGVTRYHQVYSLLVRALAEGTIRSGAALPTENELMKLYQVSRNTVRRAIDRMVRERRVVRRRGSGTYALASDRDPASWQRLAGLVHDLDRFAQATRSKCLKFARVDTPAYVLREAPDFGARSLLIVRTRQFDKTCFSVTSSYIPEAVAGKLTRARITDKLILTALKELGYVPATGSHTTHAVAADADTAPLLDVAVGTPILMTDSLSRDAHGAPLEFQRGFFLADVYPIRMDVRYDSVGTGLRWQPVTQHGGA
ncbi:GntR family transcriptional regulator [Peristeroidobacter soli]|jgi:GntR family transcriptional regulator|uniref:GntR family transcriptional regulator n=1 Tax=Peristeroidobacter soli TaxID=2497877 RepID=UPI00101D0787|nr:GntR family transcriptional regulator [Peristeroidobacter soli]